MYLLKKMIFGFAATFLVFFQITAQHHQENEFSEKFIKALESKDIEELIKLKPGPDLWRTILQKETRDMTDEEINEKANKNEKFIQDFKNIMYSAKTEKIDLSKIKFKKSKVEKIWDDPKMPVSLTIKYDYKGKDGEFALSVFKFEEKYYLSEILISYDIFDKLNEEKVFYDEEIDD